MPRLLHCRSVGCIGGSSKTLLVKKLDSNRSRHYEPTLNQQSRSNNRRAVSSAYIFLPTVSEGELLSWPQKVKSVFVEPQGSVTDELIETKLHRQCGLPVPAILKRRNERVSGVISGPEAVIKRAQNEADWELRYATSFLPSKRLLRQYLQLGKARLSGLVVVTALGGFAMCPQLCSFTTSWVPLLACALGTGLTAFGANAINQCLEAPFDAQMKRTQNRILPTRALSPLHSLSFGLLTGLLGVAVLYTGANATTAALGLANLLLYTGVYTPMKRFSVYNTWVGSLVGAVPPLIGWTACGGQLNGAGFLLAAVLFAWQFPHFNALSWNLRADYSKAGYRMMAACRPDLLRRTTLTYALWLIALSSVAAPWSGLTTFTFALTSAPLNFYFAYLAWRFYRETDSRNSKKLFRCSLIYLPALIALMLISKRPSGQAAQMDDKDAENSATGVNRDLDPGPTFPR